MIDVLKQFEAVPAAYPATSLNLSLDAQMVSSSMVWARIEAYIAHRFTEREVVWTLAGHEGDQFHPNLTPVVSSVADIWRTQWEPLTLESGPVGLCLPQSGTYRITAQVGGGNVPAPVIEAYRRLAEYMAEVEDKMGVSDYSVDMGGAIRESFKRSPAWMARAMQNSGAADLLRPYRRA